MIGTNNTGHNQQDPSETADGIAAHPFRPPRPLPRHQGPPPRRLPARPHRRPTSCRQINDAINERIAKLADGEHVHYLDICDIFLATDGTLPRRIMPDALHPQQKGYQLWAEAIEPKLTELGL